MNLDDLFDESSEIQKKNLQRILLKTKNLKALYLEMEAKYKSKNEHLQKKKVIGGSGTKTQYNTYRTFSTKVL